MRQKYNVGMEQNMIKIIRIEFYFRPFSQA